MQLAEEAFRIPEGIFNHFSLILSWSKQVTAVAIFCNQLQQESFCPCKNDLSKWPK